VTLLPNSPQDSVISDKPALAETSEASEIQAQQTRLLMQGVRSSIPASLAIAGVLSYVQWPVIDHSVVIAWLSATTLIGLLRLALALAYLKSRNEADSYRSWLRAFVAGTVLAAGTWGLGAWLLYPADSVTHQAFLGVLVAGLTAGAVTSLSPSLFASVLFLILSLVPLAIRFLASDQEVVFALGLLTVLFLGVTAIGAHRINANIIENIRLRSRSARQLEALRQSEKQASTLAMVAARTDNAVVITDSLGHVEWVNEAFARVTGYELSEVVGRTPGSVLQGPETDPQVVHGMRENLRRGQAFEAEILNYTKNGRPYWVAIEVQPIRDEAGRTVQFMAIERDITESRNRERELEEARRKAEEASHTKSNFLAMMSHEVRTPLNGLIGSLDLLQDTVLDSQQRKYVETSQRSAEWLLTIINDILDYSKMEAGKIGLEPAVFNLTSLVEGVVEMLEPRASEKAISLVTEIKPNVPRIAEGDSNKIRQILLNLTGNGIKFTSGGEVRIAVSLLETSGHRPRVRFTVSDTGKGIPLAQQGRIFEEFWTRSEDTSRGHVGTGLGLSISRRLVGLLGGEINFESRPGAGTRFWFDVPLSFLPYDAVGGNEAPFDGDPGRLDWTRGTRLNGHVLIADDNPANLMIAQSLLKRLGLSADIVDNGIKAVDAVRQGAYDLVLMDIGMPEMDGIAATQAIRASDGPVARVPIIALTAHVMRGERESLIAQGLDDYLSKPIDRTALVNCLTRWLTHERPQVNDSDQTEFFESPHEATSSIDRDILKQLLEDVGPEYGEAVVDAFILELDRQAARLEEAADKSDLDAMAQAAHRLKVSAASSGATELGRLTASIEQAARAGQTESAVGAMGEFRGLARSSKNEMDILRREIFGSGAEA
jgi:PAS domain S-box-containing protein